MLSILSLRALLRFSSLFLSPVSYLYDHYFTFSTSFIYLPVFLPVLVISILFSSFAMILSFSFIWDIFISLLILSLCVCFLLLDKSTMSFDMKVVALMKSQSCRVLQCYVPCSSELGTSGVSPLSVACALLLWLSHVCLHSSHLQWLSLPVVGRVGSLCCYWASLGTLWA